MKTEEKKGYKKENQLKYEGAITMDYLSEKIIVLSEEDMEIVGAFMKKNGIPFEEASPYELAIRDEIRSTADFIWEEKESEYENAGLSKDEIDEKYDAFWKIVEESLKKDTDIILERDDSFGGLYENAEHFLRRRLNGYAE